MLQKGFGWFMPLTAVLQGFALGLAYIAPIGMQNLFVIDSALCAQKRRRIALTLLAVVLFDISLSLSCFFGIGLAMGSLPWLGRAVQLVGGILVLGIGIALIIPKKKSRNAIVVSDKAPSTKGILRIFAGAFIVTWCNPQAIIDGTMLLGASRMTFGDVGGFFVLGVCAATFIWFPTLAFVTSLLGSRLNDRVLRIVNVVCGSVVALYGARLLVSFFISL